MSQTSDVARDRILILASINLDVTHYVHTLPKPGETVLALGRAQGLGGKGANQSVAASRLGEQVTVLGVLGADDAGTYLLDELDRAGVETHLISQLTGEESGRAEITVDDAGENVIVVHGGAHPRLNAPVLGGLLNSSALDDVGFAVGLTQGELPPDSLDAFAAYVADRGTRFVLNLAPIVPVRMATIAAADPLVVNEEEARKLLRDLGVEHARDDIDSIITALADMARSAVITLGGNGAIASDGTEIWRQPAPKPECVVDTTGAGDAFVGALTAALASGETLRRAVLEGVVVGSIAVTKRGTTSSYPTADERDALVQTVSADSNR